MKKIVLIILTTLVLVSCNEDDKDLSYTVTFETDGGTPVPSAQKVEEGSAVSAPSTNPAKTGYVFVYWHLSGATTAYNFQWPVTSDFTLYARWQEEAKAAYWQVAWNLNGGLWGSGDNHATQVLKGGTLAEPAEPVRSGYAFEGWYKESALTNKINFPYDVSNLTADFTLYAKWTSGTQIDNIVLNKTSLSIYTTGTEQLVATVSPAGAQAVSYSTSNKGVAIVNEEGMVKATGEGTAVITAKVGDKSATCTVTVSASVFVAGHYSGTSVSKGILWINGEKHESQDKFYQEKYRSVCVYDGDIYVVGERREGSGDDYHTMPALWKNGVLQSLEMNSKNEGGVAWDVFVLDGNVYVAGHEKFLRANTTNDISYRAVYWKNGKMQKLTDNEWGEPDAYSIFVQGTNVYVSGRIHGVKYSPAIWKNGQLQRLSEEQGDASSIFVSGNDVYVAGSLDGGRRTSNNLPILVPVMWKNGVLEHLDAQGYGYAESIYVAEKDVYVAGSRRLFKNGAVQMEDENGHFESVYVYGGDVYTAGYIKTGNENAEAVLFKNNQRQELSKDGLRGYNVIAYSVFVR